MGFDLLLNSTFRYEYCGADMFVVLDGMRIARRRLDLGQRGNVVLWEQLVPDFWVQTSRDYTSLIVEMDVEGEGTFYCEMTCELGPLDKDWLAQHG
jgi:hypothetical protein